MPVRVLSAVLAWGIANASPSARPDRPRVLLWPVSPALASELPASIDARFDLADRSAFETELGAARRSAQADVRTRLAAVEAALAEAREHYVAQRWDEMQQVLQRVEDGELALLADPRRCEVLWELEFRLGLVGRGLHTPDETRRRNLFALALAPDRRVAREVYGPEVAAEFLEAVDARAGQVVVPVRIDVAASEAIVHVDCRPVRGDHVDLAPGLHVVHARAMGQATVARLFEVPQLPEVEVALARAPSDDAVVRLGHGLADGSLVLERASHRRALVEAATARDADIVVTLDASGDAVLARVLVGAARGPAVRRPTATQAIADALAAVTDDGHLRAGTTLATAATTREGEPKPHARKPVVRSWWFWTTIAFVVGAGLGVGLGVGLHQRSSDRVIVYGPR